MSLAENSELPKSGPRPSIDPEKAQQTVQDLVQAKNDESDGEIKTTDKHLRMGRVNVSIGVKTSFFYKIKRHLSGKALIPKNSEICSDVSPKSMPMKGKREKRAEEKKDDIGASETTFFQKLNLLYQRMKDILVGDNTVNPSRELYFNWLCVINIAILYNITFVLARTAFYHLQLNYFEFILVYFDYLADVLYVLDIYVRCRSSYMDNGCLVQDSETVLKNYIVTQKVLFSLEIFSCIPFDHVARYANLIKTSSPTIWFLPAALRLNRCIKFDRLGEVIDRAETKTIYPNVFRITVLCLGIMMTVHVNACVWFGFSRWLGLESDGWVYPPKGTGWSTNDTILNSLSRQYIFSLYWSTITLTTIGEYSKPTSNLEYLFQLFNFLAGVLIFASIVGNVGTMIQQANAQKTQFQTKVDSIKQYMQLRKVSPDLQLRIIKWFDYLWREGKTVDEEAVLMLLPDKLRADVAMNVHLETLSNVKLFSDTEPGFLLALVLKLRPQVYSPLDFVCKKGDIGRDMYIVKEGELEVVSEDLSKRFCTLKAGSYMGELSILDIPGRKSGNRRTAHVRAIGYCDLFALSGEDLNSVMNDYPEAKALITERGQAILRKDNLLDEDLMKKEMARANIDIADMAQSIETISEHMVNLQTQILVLNESIKIVVDKIQEDTIHAKERRRRRKSQKSE